MSFMPISKQDMQERGIKQLDFVYIIGDAYVDHPSFGAAIISRLLEYHGYTVGIIAQPDFHDPQSVLHLGLPRLAWLVTAGNIDSMVAHYTAAKKKRSDDLYSPGGRAGKRPDRAATVYCRMCRNAAPEIPLLCGGLEVSLRRFAHYDYCKNLNVDHREYLSILRKLRALPEVKRVFIRSGIRYDYLIEDKNEEFMNELIEHHISGQLSADPHRDLTLSVR